MYIRKDDFVVVITGDDKGPEPRKVLRVLAEKNKIIVEGVNRVWKHMKPSQKNQQGGRLSKEMPINASNVMLYSPTARRGVRVGFRFTESGQKERYCKVSGASLGAVGPVKPAHATGKKPVAAGIKA
jgi:large subunit ribosomal protein L24